MKQNTKRPRKAAKRAKSAPCIAPEAAAPRSRDASLQTATASISSAPAIITEPSNDFGHEVPVEKLVADLGPKPVGGDAFYYVDDLAKWKALTNFQVSYEDTSDYWRPRIKKRSIFMDAVAKAMDFFAKAGAMHPIAFADDAIEIHVHPKTHTVAFLFKRHVAGVPLECAETYQLSPDMVGWLKATGRWNAITEH